MQCPCRHKGLTIHEIKLIVMISQSDVALIPWKDITKDILNEIEGSHDLFTVNRPRRPHTECRIAPLALNNDPCNEHEITLSQHVHPSEYNPVTSPLQSRCDLLYRPQIWIEKSPYVIHPGPAVGHVVGEAQDVEETDIAMFLMKKTFL